MNRRNTLKPRALSILGVILLLCLSPVLCAQDNSLSRFVAVVYNSQEPGAADLARLYARGRGITDEQIIEIRCDRGEVVTRDHFDFKIKWPIREQLQKRKLYHFRLNPQDEVHNEESIRYLVLIRGIPLKIAATSASEPMPDYLIDKSRPDQKPPAELNRNDAAVDTELCLLPLIKYPLTGPFPNFYFNAKDRFVGNNQMILVTRLDGPTYQDVEKMIKDTLIAERNGGVKGKAFIDARGIKEGPYAIGDFWLRSAAADFKKKKVPVVFDEQEALFGPKVDMRDAAFYFGWYASDICGPMKPGDFRFPLGAVAYHIYSFSANTLRSPEANWCGPLISRGVVATMGAVNEPYLLFTPDVGVFANRLLRGWNFADSAYASQRMVSWQITIIGDPLYRPYPQGKE
ncbi:MAG: TIGR03790 family protein [Verrucomicrobiota bacterium]|nr:TIGR03790 family protein [Verrucomicrobiota bacterium]